MVADGDCGAGSGEMGAGNESRGRTHAKAAGRKRVNKRPRKKMLKSDSEEGVVRNVIY